MEPDIKATILGLISVAISLFALYFEKYRVMIISIYSIFLVGYILFTSFNRFEEHEKKIREIQKSLKRAEDLIEIRADIKNLKKRGTR